MSEPNRCCTDSPPEEDGLEKTGKAYRKQDMEVVERALVRLRRAEFRCDWSAEEESWDHLLNAGAIHKLMILPIYSWIQWWDLVIVLCVFWSAFIVPFRLAFLEFDEDPSSNEWFAADIIVDMLYICDTAMHFFRAIRRERDRKLIYTYRGIAQEYLLGFFWIDITAALPYDLIISYAEGLTFTRTLRLLRLLRIVNLVRAGSRLNIFPTTPQTQNMWRFLKCIGIFSFSCHWMACGYYLVAENTSKTAKNWIIVDELDGESLGNRYVAAMYVGVQLVMGGPFQAQTPPERSFYILARAWGAVVFAYVLSQIGVFISNRDAVSYTHLTLPTKRIV
eukprot:TRINITY_DN5546_c0_g1_i3.p1 TRINITY_DN5546_c0_g1~~TRINITY_DN5546_c0_g1_i3.p1  ORF type:complete len:335 (-),score=75.65 TRINITY_DN5546_c0_g1_i3:152-1156(-)